MVPAARTTDVKVYQVLTIQYEQADMDGFISGIDLGGHISVGRACGGWCLDLLNIAEGIMH